jgi:hypothetical protein
MRTLRRLKSIKEHMSRYHQSECESMRLIHVQCTNLIQECSREVVELAGFVDTYVPGQAVY